MSPRGYGPGASQDENKGRFQRRKPRTVACSLLNDLHSKELLYTARQDFTWVRHQRRLVLMKADKQTRALCRESFARNYFAYLSVRSYICRVQICISCTFINLFYNDCMRNVWWARVALLTWSRHWAINIALFPTANENNVQFTVFTAFVYLTFRLYDNF